MKLIRFILIGGIGFIIEAVIITLAGRVWEVPPLHARFISFPVAVLVTWWLNRRYNFRSDAAATSESLRYMVAQSIGAAVNFGVYTISVLMVPAFMEWPIVALGIGAVAGLVVNFSLSCVFVFQAVSRDAGGDRGGYARYLFRRVAASSSIRRSDDEPE